MFIFFAVFVFIPDAKINRPSKTPKPTQTIHTNYVNNQVPLQSVASPS